MRFGRIWRVIATCSIVGVAAIMGCSREETLPCQPELRYASARSAPPVQIPDDLSPPDERDAIRLPADVAPGGVIKAGDCLEAPPPFSGDTRPFLTSEDGKQSRKQRREAKRAERAEASAAQPAAQPEAAPPAQADPPPANDDRVISN